MWRGDLGLTHRGRHEGIVSKFSYETSKIFKFIEIEWWLPGAGGREKQGAGVP